MAEPESSTLIFKDLMASVGETLLVWGWLEVEILKKLEASGHALFPRVPPIQQWRIASVRSAADVSSWTVEIERAVQIRNLLAHGLVGGNALPEEGEPFVVCRGMDGQLHTITLNILKETAQSIDGLRLRLMLEPDDMLCPLQA